jgi:glycolate oxidase subunit GlcD
MAQYQPITEPIRRKIEHELGSECIVTDLKALEIYNRDASELVHSPELVIRPQTVDQIQQLLRLANEHRFPVTPRGAGTGLAGGCLPLLGGVVLSLEAMNRIRCIDSQNLVADVEPGVITKTLRDAVREKGLFYPPDPAGLDKSTIGGNAATNAGGPACVKYGTTKDYVLGLQAVLPDGSLIHTGTKTRKGVVGYDLTHLLIGSEGTLGVITGLTLKLIPHPRAVSGLAAVFEDLQTATHAVTAVMSRGHLPSAIEFMDCRCLTLVGELLPFSIPGQNAALLIVETDGAPDSIRAEIEAIGRICREVGASRILPAPQAEDRDALWHVRRQISLRIHDTSVLYIPEDVAVPLNRIAELVEALPEFEARYNFKIYTFGHAGDGNIHLNITATSRNDLDLVEAGVRAILARVLQMEGTISGEHGVGEAKMRFLPMELSPQSVRLQQSIKRLFDPNLILNPGKIFPDLTPD